MGAVQMESGAPRTHQDGRCRVCGCALERVRGASEYSPEEWGCPACDGGMTPEEIEAQSWERE